MYKNELINNLKVNEKYTIVSINDFGFPVVRNVKIHKAFNEKYAQFSNSLVLHVTDKNKRTKRGVRYTDQDVVIFEGWYNVNECINSDNKTSEFVSFDTENFQSIIKSVNCEPVYINM